MEAGRWFKRPALGLFQTMTAGRDKMQVRALASFDSLYGPVKRGEVFWAEEHYLKQLDQNPVKMYEKMPDRPTKEPRIRHQAFAAAPRGADPLPARVKTPAAANEAPQPMPADSEELQTNGKAKLSRSSRRAQARRVKTPNLPGDAQE